VKCPALTPRWLLWGTGLARLIKLVTFGYVDPCRKCKERQFWLDNLGHRWWIWWKWDRSPWGFWKRPKRATINRATRHCRGCGDEDEEHLGVAGG